MLKNWRTFLSRGRCVPARGQRRPPHSPRTLPAGLSSLGLKVDHGADGVPAAGTGPTSGPAYPATREGQEAASKETADVH